MNEAAFIDKGSFPHQAKFAAGYFASDSPRKHLLVGAPGTGKGYTAAAIVNHAMSSLLARRVLVLAPAPLLVQWQEMIRRGDVAAPVLVVDRRCFRELEDSVPVGQEIWPERVVAILSFDFAKQVDVASALSRCPWDLLVADEVHHAAPQTLRGKVLLDLMDKSPQMRVLLVQTGGFWTTPDIETSAGVFRDAEVTVWTRDTLRDQQGRELLPAVQIEWVSYRRRPEEAELVSRLQDAVGSLDMTDSRMRLAAATLLQSASSSPFALEQRLRRIRQRRNELVHSIEVDEVTESEAEELGMAKPEGGNTEDLMMGYVELSRITEPLLEILEELPGDSKCDALLSLLNSVGTARSQDRRVCVFTRYVDTATYLSSTLRDYGSHVSVLTGGISFADREQILAQFEESGGILIATESLEMRIPEVAAVVFYDLPLNPAVLEARIGQFVRVGRSAPLRIMAFADESNPLEIERLQRRIADIRQSLSEREIDETLF